MLTADCDLSVVVSAGIEMDFDGGAEVDAIGLFAWVHLSDIGRDVSFLERLKEDIVLTARRGKARSPDVILVTGNVGIGVRTKEFEQSKKWLLGLSKALRLKPNCVFVVPGERDLDSELTEDREAWRLVRHLRAPTHPLDDMDVVLANDHERKVLARRFGAYLGFSGSVMSSCESKDGLFWYHKIWGGEGIRIRLVGLNTAILCASDDKGDVPVSRLGRAQIDFALAPSPESLGELAIVLSHYPIRDPWLIDAVDSKAWVRAWAHVQLSGCPGDRESEVERSGSGLRSVHLTAGLGGTSDEYIYRLAIVVICEGGTPVLRVWPRRWSSKNKGFRPAEDLLEDGQLFYDIELSGARLGIGGPHTVKYRHERSFYEEETYSASRSDDMPYERAGVHGKIYYVTFRLVRQGKMLALLGDLGGPGESISEEWKDGKFVESSPEGMKIPEDIRRGLLLGLDGLPVGAEFECTETRLVKKVNYLFEVTIDGGRLVICRDREEIASGLWQDGKIVELDAELGDDDEMTQEIYQALERKIVELYDGV